MISIIILIWVILYVTLYCSLYIQTIYRKLHITYVISTYKFFYEHTYITNGSIYERVCVCVLYVYKRIFIYLYVCMYSASSLWYIYYIYSICTYVVFYVHIGVTPSQQVRYLGTPTIRCPYQGCLSVLYIIYINIQYTYKNVRYRHNKRGKHT